MVLGLALSHKITGQSEAVLPMHLLKPFAIILFSIVPHTAKVKQLFSNLGGIQGVKCQGSVRSPSQVDIKLQNLSSAAAYILQKYHIYYQVYNKENKGPCGHDNQVQGLCVLVSGNISKGNAESTTYLNYII
jgi:hypothetical protein